MNLPSFLRHRRSRKIAAHCLAALCLLFSSPSQASSLCVSAYETAANDYWRIVSDMTEFKALFDNYNTLCQKFYPEEIDRLQPAADQLRAQTAQDIKDAPRVITRIFAEILPTEVPRSCAASKKSRDQARHAFLTRMQTRAKSMNARMQKSASTLHDPGDSLKLCRDLGALAPKIKEKLGPDLSTPLLTMSELNSRFMVGDAKKMKKSFAVYRETLRSLSASP